jgi:hypothetical protein
MKMLLAALLLSAAITAARAEPCCGPITPAGQKLISVFDSSGVDHLWIVGHQVDTDTGEPIAGDNRTNSRSTHCSHFVAAISKRLGVPMLRPEQIQERSLASAQGRWLASGGGGWRRLPDVRAAQAAANRGELVVAVKVNPDPNGNGHIAFVRPSAKTAEQLATEGPEATQAGYRNFIDGDLSRGMRLSAAFYAHGL